MRSDLVYRDVCSGLFFCDVCNNFVNDYAIGNFLLFFFVGRRGGRLCCGYLLVMINLASPRRADKSPLRLMKLELSFE